MRTDLIFTDAKAGETNGEWAQAVIPAFQGGVRVAAMGTCEAGFDSQGRAKGEIEDDYKNNLIQIGFTVDGEATFIFARDADQFALDTAPYDDTLVIRYQVQAHGFIQIIQFRPDQINAVSGGS